MVRSYSIAYSSGNPSCSFAQAGKLNICTIGPFDREEELIGKD
jgi:hypothetical protein